MPTNSQPIVEYRGVTDLVAAEILTDTAGSYSTGEVFEIAGVAEITKTNDSSNEAHFYNNMPAVVVSNVSSDTINLNVSAIPLDVLAKITGQKYDSVRGALYEGPRQHKYFAIGYKTTKTDGSPIYVWRLKGTFNIPDQTNTTENSSTDANGQTLVYTGIRTTHKFANNTDEYGQPQGANSTTVDVAADLADVSHFFDAVTTPDTLPAKTPVVTYTVTNTLTYCTTNNPATNVVSGNPYAAKITADTGYTLELLSVSMGGNDISDTAVSGSAITIPAVTGAVIITAAAAEQT